VEKEEKNVEKEEKREVEENESMGAAPMIIFH